MLSTRDVSGQSTPESVDRCGAHEFWVGVCAEEEAVLVFIVIFILVLLVLTFVLNLRRRARARARRRSTLSAMSPPPYSTVIGLPASSSRDSMSKASPSTSPNPALDPYHIVPSSFDYAGRSPLKDELFGSGPGTGVSEPARALSPRVRSPSAEPGSPFADPSPYAYAFPPPPAYARAHAPTSPRAGAL